MVEKLPLRLITAVALGVVVLSVLLAACDTDVTNGYWLVNDTQDTLEFEFCSTDCATSGGMDLVEPGYSVPQYAFIGDTLWWQVRDLEGQVLGCLKVDDDRASKPQDRFVSKDLERCPE